MITDEELLKIAGAEVTNGIYYGSVKQLRAAYRAGLAEGIRRAQALVPTGVARPDEMYDALMAIDAL